MHSFPEKLHQAPSLIQNAGTHRAKRGEDHPFHRDGFWELMYVRQGQVVCQQEAARYALHSGMAILHPALALHGDFAVNAYETYYIWLDLPLVETDKAWPRVCYDDETRQMERICGAIVREWNQNYKNLDRTSERMLQLLAGQLTIVIERQAPAPEQAAGEQIVSAAEQVMETDYHQPLTVADIATRVHTSPSSLYSYFAALRGQTPMATLQAIRLRHALVHLHHSTRTLAAVASLCGYCSASHLTKHVIAATGRTPGKLRATTTEKEKDQNYFSL